MKILIATISLLLSASAFAESGYVVNAEVLNQNSSLGAPTLALKSNVSSKISVEGSYSLSLAVSPVSETSALLKTELKVGEEFHQPSMMVELDKETKLTMNDNTTLIVTVKKA